MEAWKQIEFEYGKKLRESTLEERKSLYYEAYSRVSRLRAQEFTSDDPEKRTAGTSNSLVGRITKFCSLADTVLEIGCGRGYTCLKLHPYVKSIVGIDVSYPALEEARVILKANKIYNVKLLAGDALSLIKDFDVHSFNKVVSIDIVEHLHPDDAQTHFYQVFSVLKPGGAYIIVAPNRLNGPHDITRHAYPDAKEPLGFHLNEMTYKELVGSLSNIGFKRFYSFHYGFPFFINGISYPSMVNIFFEKLYSGATSIQFLRNVLIHRIVNTAANLFLKVKMIAYKDE